MPSGAWTLARATRGRSALRFASRARHISGSGSVEPCCVRIRPRRRSVRHKRSGPKRETRERLVAPKNSTVLQQRVLTSRGNPERYPFVPWLPVAPVTCSRREPALPRRSHAPGHRAGFVRGKALRAVSLTRALRPRRSPRLGSTVQGRTRFAPGPPLRLSSVASEVTRAGESHDTERPSGTWIGHFLPRSRNGITSAGLRQYGWQCAVSEQHQR